MALVNVVNDRPVLVVNAGSTSTKLHLVDPHEHSEPLESLECDRTREAGAVAHRIVHGGPRFRDPVLIDEQVIEDILGLRELAPLHNGPALRAVEQARDRLPELPHVAVFDTGFHRTIPPYAATYALPRAWREQWGIRRYGFHGLSVAWCAERVPQLIGQPAQGLRLVVCHLGGGCSVTAVRDGRSVDTTMGFSPLEGVPMASRSGSVDPSAVLYAIHAQGLSADQVEHVLNFKSGLTGLAGNGDMARLQEAAHAGDPQAELAIELLCHRVAGAVAAMAASAGGLDALAFTAGMGEHSSTVRERVCARLAFLGVVIDSVRNTHTHTDSELSAPSSAVHVLVVEAREELIAARGARAVLDAS